jgi:hypothetical protein
MSTHLESVGESELFLPVRAPHESQIQQSVRKSILGFSLTTSLIGGPVHVLTYERATIE